MGHRQTASPLACVRRVRSMLTRSWPTRVASSELPHTRESTLPNDGATTQAAIRGVCTLVYQISKLSSVKPSLSNAGLHANLIMGGGPHTRTCTAEAASAQATCVEHARHDGTSARLRALPWRWQVCLDLGGKKTDGVSIRACGARAQAPPHTMSAEMNPTPCDQPAGGRSNV